MHAIAFISDLHANTVALEAVLRDLQAAGIERIVCLGDVVDLGPEPCALVDRLIELNIPCVRGNHDVLEDHPKAPHLARIENWTRDVLGAERLAWLAARPDDLVLDLAGRSVRGVHGTPRSFHDSIVPTTPDADLEAYAREAPFDVLVCGHTHVALTRFVAHRLVVNVGSVGMPFAEPFHGKPPQVLPYSDYAILRANAAGELSVQHCRRPLDVEAFRRSVRRSELPGAEEWLRQWE